MHAGFRDAVHVPFILVVCDATLQPGDKCSLRDDDHRCVKWGGSPNEPMWHGVADPFLEEPIPAGSLFAVHIRKECYSKLTHNFQIEVHDRGGTDTCHEVCNLF